MTSTPSESLAPSSVPGDEGGDGANADGTKHEPVTVADWEAELSGFGSLFADFERVDGDDPGHATWAKMACARTKLAERIVASRAPSSSQGSTEETKLVGYISDDGLRLLRAGVPASVFPVRGDPAHIALHVYGSTPE